MLSSSGQEIGHLFGAFHETALRLRGWNCPLGRIMDPVRRLINLPISARFSRCTATGMREVLENKARFCFVAMKSVCGNFRVDLGEQCDCGSPPEVCAMIKSCCDPKNCQLRIDCAVPSQCFYSIFSHQLTILHFSHDNLGKHTLPLHD